MEVVYHKYFLGKMLTQCSCICCRKVCTYSLYMFLVIAEPFPESIKSILAVAITDINNMPIIQIYNYSLVYLSLMSCKLINGDTS